jgi:hypothetical protein
MYIHFDSDLIAECLAHRIELKTRESHDLHLSFEARPHGIDFFFTHKLTRMLPASTQLVFQTQFVKHAAQFMYERIFLESVHST